MGTAYRSIKLGVTLNDFEVDWYGTPFFQMLLAHLENFDVEVVNQQIQEKYILSMGILNEI